MTFVSGTVWASPMAAPGSLLVSSSLPLPRTRLIGREAERATARSFLLDDAVPILTLTGSGGVGKTRLALAIAAELADHFGDGSILVDLSPLRDPSLVLAAIASALDIRECGIHPPLDVLTTALYALQLLLILDNCEHLLAAAPDIATLLVRCPRLQVLATSRAPLHIQGEQELAVPPLALPPADGAAREDLAQYEAVALFLQRARAVDHAFAPSQDDLHAIAAACRRLDGLPLAIELAAARTKILPPAALLERLERRLPLLVDGSREAPMRQQTMRDTIAWSHDLLREEERVLFRRLAVFEGGCTLAAIEAVAVGSQVAPLELVKSLVEQSLLQRVEGAAGEPRYRMLETIREFAAEQLLASADQPATRRRHAAWCLVFAEQAGILERGQDDRLRLDRLEAERDNLRAALDWLLQIGEIEDALRLGTALDDLWFHRGPVSEGRVWLTRALQRPTWRRCLADCPELSLAGSEPVGLDGGGRGRGGHPGRRKFGPGTQCRRRGAVRLGAQLAWSDGDCPEPLCRGRRAPGRGPGPVSRPGRRP